MTMKYAFLFGSNVFIIPSNVISYVDNDETNEFLKIKSICDDNDQHSSLTIDTDFKDTEGRGLQLHDNEVVKSFGYKVSKTQDSILAKGFDNSTVLEIQQLDEESTMQLEDNIVAELAAHAPVTVFRIRGDFMMGKMHVAVDNNKFSIGRDSYASSAITGNSTLKFTPSGLVM
jgi:hypothetical protein